MNIVVIESPYAGDVSKNLTYLRAALKDCLTRREAPFASHGLYTQDGVLDDSNPEERELGMAAGFAFRPSATKTVVYCDHGITPGMWQGIAHAQSLGQEVEFRWLIESK